MMHYIKQGKLGPRPSPSLLFVLGFFIYFLSTFFINGGVMGLN